MTQTVPPLGTCICGYPTWLLVDGVPLHPCCADNRPNCEPCRISRDANRRYSGRSRPERWTSAEWVKGSGPYCVVARCGVITVTRHETQEAAEAAKARIDNSKCGHACTGDHQIVHAPE